MTTQLPRPAIKPNKIKKWIRTKFLSPYINKIPKGQKTLDLACGWGFSFDINPDFWGVEIDDDCVNYCIQQGYKVTKANLLEPLPFTDGFFDNCFSHDVLEHFEIEEVDMIFAGVYKVLRTGGKLINVIPNRKGYDYGLTINVGHKHFITPDEISQIAARMGFEYLGANSVPVPAFMNGLFTHAKYVTICRKI